MAIHVKNIYLKGVNFLNGYLLSQKIMNDPKVLLWCIGILIILFLVCKKLDECEGKMYKKKLLKINFKSNE